MATAEDSLDLSTLIRHVPKALSADDLRPLRIRRRKHSPSPPQRRSVFQSSSDWAAPSTATVLDAFHQSLTHQVAEHDCTKTQLALSRAAGSVGVDATMADIFQVHTARPTAFRTSSQSRPFDSNLLQCSTCMRPVLLSRFLHHMALCAAHSDKRSAHLDKLHPSDAQLLTSPYISHKTQLAKLDPAQPAPSDNAHPHPQSPNLPKLHMPPHLAEEEDDWHSSLTSLAPCYVPRGSSNKRRRVALPPPSETSSQRKKNVNIERKALSAAATMGMHPSSSLPDSAKHELRIYNDAAAWGCKVPWARLMQISMPVALPRAPKRKFNSPRDSPTQSAGQVGTAKSRTESDKATNAHTPVPSLAASLLWLRGHSSKELTNSSLNLMDIPPPPLAKSGAIFHGQSFVAPVGTFETDPRTASAIKIPLANTVSPALPAKNRPAANGTAQRFNSVGPRAKKVAGPTTSTGNSNQVAKKQRPTKQRPVTNSNVPTSAPIQAKTTVAAQRKVAGRMSPSLTPNAKLVTSAIEAQRLAANRNAAQISASTVAASGAANASAAAAANFPSVSAPQKKAYRPVNASNYATAAAAAARGVVAGQAAGMNTAAQLAARNGSRVMKARSHPSVAASPTSSVARASLPTKSQSPGQTSSRGSDRMGMHRANAVTPPGYDPVLMAAAANGPNVANRMKGIRAGTGIGAPFGIQQVMAQVAAQGAHQQRARDDGANLARTVVPDMSKAPLLAGEQLASQMSRQGMRGISPQTRVKQSGSNVHSGQVRLTPGHKSNGRQQVRVQARKDEREVHGKADIGLQLRQVEAMQNEAVASNVEVGVSPGAFVKRGEHGNVSAASQGFYSAALAAVSNQASTAAMTTSQRMALMQMAQAVPVNAAPIAAQTGSAQNVLQNLHDMHSLQNLGVVSAMQGAAAVHNNGNNMLNFLPGGGLSPGAATKAPPMPAAVAPVLPSGSLPPTQNVARFSGDLLQQLLARPGAMAANAGLHGQQVNAAVAAGALNAHVLVTRPMTMAQQQQQQQQQQQRPMAQSEAMAAPADNDFALTISFDESDLLD